jgi:hypothetical protein
MLSDSPITDVELLSVSKIVLWLLLMLVYFGPEGGGRVELGSWTEDILRIS